MPSAGRPRVPPMDLPSQQPKMREEREGDGEVMEEPKDYQNGGEWRLFAFA